jgi:ankyrin repeat protein
MPEETPPSERDQDDSAAVLLEAARNGRTDRVHALLDAGVDIEHRGDDSRTALMCAAEFGQASVVQELLGCGAAVDAVDTEGNTALLLAARCGCVEAVRELLLWDADVDHANSKGQTALYLAAWCPVLREAPAALRSRHKGHDEAVRELIKGGANTEYYEIGGLQPVAAAAQNGNVAATLDLLSAGARFLSDEIVGGNLLRRVATEGNVAAVREILDRGGEFFGINDARHPNKYTALTCAASARQYVTARELLDRGAVVSDTDRALFDDWLKWLEVEAENAYEKMYGAPNNTAAAGHYSNVKEFTADALALARRLGRFDTFSRLEARLVEIKAVFRSEFC